MSDYHVVHNDTNDPDRHIVHNNVNDPDHHVVSEMSTTPSFIADIQTTVDAETFTQPLVSGTMDFIVAWGDGTEDHITAFDQAEVTHTYATAGIHRLRITGTLPRWKFDGGGDKNKIISVIQFGNIFDTLEDSFLGCSNLTSFVLDKADKILTIDLAWKETTGLTSFDASALINVTEAFEAWRDSTITSFTTGTDGLKKCTNISRAWYGSDFTSFDASNLIAATNAIDAWNKGRLTSFDSSAMINITDCSQAWRSCNLATFDASGLTAAINIFSAWFDNNLESFDASMLGNVTNCGSAWEANSLTSFDASALTSVVLCDSAWRGNDLTSFDPSGLTAVTTLSNAWLYNDLDQTSVDAIIDVLADNIKSPGFVVGIAGGTSSPPSAAAQLRIDNELTPAGYTVYTN